MTDIPEVTGQSPPPSIPPADPIHRNPSNGKPSTQHYARLRGLAILSAYVDIALRKRFVSRAGQERRTQADTLSRAIKMYLDSPVVVAQRRNGTPRKWHPAKLCSCGAFLSNATSRTDDDITYTITGVCHRHGNITRQVTRPGTGSGATGEATGAATGESEVTDQ